MSVTTELHIVAPGVCGPLAEMQPLKASHTVNKWVKNLSRSVCTPSFSSADEIFLSLLNLSAESDFPTAALSMIAHDLYDESLNYMCADPVHLQADMDHAILTSSDDLSLQKNESDIFCGILNQHFKQDGLAFFNLNQNQWVVATKNKIQIDTTPLTDAIGRNVNFILPKGEVSGFWKQVLTEAQMLMHAHDINSTREESGQLSINSLWFHGQGDLPDLKLKASLSICSNDTALKGLARHVKCNFLSVPDSVEEYKKYLLSGTDEINVLHISDLEHLVNYSDVNIWLDKLTEVLDNWLYPLIAAMNKNNVKVSLYPCNKKQYQFSRYDSLKFWRQGKLEQHVRQY